MKILILAGGFATRLWPLTERRAKPLLLLDGKTILAHILEQLPQDAEKILLTNKKFEKDFCVELKTLGQENVEIFCEDSFSDSGKIGALGAVSLAVNHFKMDEDLLVVAGDNLLPELKVETLFCSGGEARLAVQEVKTLHEARKFGVVQMGEKKRVISFEEKPKNPKSKLVSTGFFGIGGELLPVLHDFAKRSPDSLGAVFTEFLGRDVPVFATEVSGAWFDVGSFETYLEAHKVLQKESLKMRAVKNLNNKYSGKVFVGDGCEIVDCQIRDSIIYPGARLKNCIISQCVLDEDCVLEGVDLNSKLVRRGTFVRQ